MYQSETCSKEPSSNTSTALYDQQRNQMWIQILGRDYIFANKNEKKRLKMEFAKQHYILPHHVTLDTYKKFFPKNPKLEPLQGLKGFNTYDNNIPLRKENTMTTHTCVNLAQKDPVETQRDYLRDRLSDVFYKKEKELSKQFFMKVDSPKTLADFLDRVKNGKYTLPEKVTDSDAYWGVCDFFYQVDWRLPGQKADPDGFKKAMNVLHEQKTKVKDTIMIADPADGLKALQEFENWTYTAA